MNDDNDTSMQHLIELADSMLDRMRGRTSFNSGSSANESNASRVSRETRSTAQAEQGFAITVSLGRQSDSCDDSTGSNTTILCSRDELEVAEASTPIAVADQSYGQEVIVISTPAMETRISRRARRNVCPPPNADTSVIDLSNYQEVGPVMAPIVIISSDEEEGETSRTVPTSLPPRLPQYSSTELNTTSSIERTSDPVSSTIPARRPTRRINITNTQHQNIIEISLRESMPTSTESLPVAEPLPNPNRDKTRPSRPNRIICPICYERLANRKAISTSCGHVFCSKCLLHSLRRFQNCPVCKESLTNSNKMHPVYFATE
ncbi:uncharacterized protein LOC126561174 [Anopheles maculipalpis]|uniref:uncharacterized protein LOC126561174 n=1 Tax=Anopheles maculipalpis TaxID=1496333 RepID=UPI002158CFC2|nr:uncharacterized protein LOC126561174 [Anopheles maculipalpis]